MVNNNKKRKNKLFLKLRFRYFDQACEHLMN